VSRIHSFSPHGVLLLSRLAFRLLLGNIFPNYETLQLEYSTGEWEISKSPKVVLTVRSSAWRYLASEMGPADDYLVFSWSDKGWIAGVLPRSFPSGQVRAMKARLDQYTIFIPQPDKLDELNGCKLEYEGRLLSVV
jgi:hypothetical protein